MFPIRGNSCVREADMIKVKICGITNLEDAALCSREGADALGFIFTKKSPRYINVKQAAKIIGQLDPVIITAGVFLDEGKEKVLEIAGGLKLDVLQFHGKESPAYCNFFKDKFKVIKVFFPQGEPSLTAVSHYKVDAYMFDVKKEEKIKGKSILSVDILKDIEALIKTGHRTIIAGGLNLKNISQVIRMSPYGVDITSGVEKMVGKKDINLVRQLIQRVKNVGSR